MALNDTAPTGSGKVTGGDSKVSFFWIDWGGFTVRWKKTESTKVEEWYALTYSAATTVFSNLTDQPATANDTYVYDYQLADPVVNGYTLRRTLEKVENTVAP